MLGGVTDGMASTEVFNTSNSTLHTESPFTTESTDKFNLSEYLLKNYIIIIIPSVFACIFLIILFIVLIKKIINNRRLDPKLLETYSSVNYDDESIDEELEHEDLMYTSCKLLVGGEYEETPELTNSEPEYDCMSVDIDVSMGAHESSIVDWNKSKAPQPRAQDVAQSLKTIPRSFWKR